MAKNRKIEEVILATVSLTALVGGLMIQNRLFAYLSIGFILFCAIFILGRNLPGFANISEENPKVKTMRMINWFTCGFVVIGVVFSIFVEKSIFSGWQERWLSILLVVVLMVVIGNNAPRLPFNRYVGLRLPWTVRDEETWILAHRILGYVTFPLVICFIVMNQFFDLQISVVATILAWILIPGILSGIFFLKKYKSVNI